MAFDRHDTGAAEVGQVALELQPMNSFSGEAVQAKWVDKLPLLRLRSSQ